MKKIMITLDLKKEQPIEPPPLSGQRLGYELVVEKSKTFLTDAWQEPSGSWMYVDRIAGRNKPAASLGHALELGIASAARWIAVALLKNRKRQNKGKALAGVAFWLVRKNKTTYTVRLHNSNRNVASHTVLGEIEKTGMFWIVPDIIGIKKILADRWYATEEQALAVVIYYAAPWIANEIATGAKP